MKKRTKRKPLSRQRKWQIKQRKAGNCTQCGVEADGRPTCATCHRKSIERNRSKRGHKPWREGFPGRPPKYADEVMLLDKSR